jgi:hypothetical protein
LSFLASTLLVVATIFVIELFIHLGHQYWKYVLAAVFGVAALALMIGNVGDLTHGWQGGGSISEDSDETETDGAG